MNFISLNSGDSGSEGSSNASDENQQVYDRLPSLHVLSFAFSNNNLKHRHIHIHAGNSLRKKLCN